ncbi:50S ribosomal protein L24 [Wolbachia endosymbiont of Pentidionis agamae]|uniref:50S ribosomal protein L24 n=1 Tax=Wolbachia endosymbiont of Pentidionis agamae TaxID=3110435 RepID=UPI0038CD8BB2
MGSKLKVGDDVIVLAGNDKGKIGKIIGVINKNLQRKMIVSGINLHKRHVKGRNGKASDIVTKEMPIDVSNIAMLDPKFRTPTKVGFKFIDSKKLRFAKVSGEIIN